MPEQKMTYQERLVKEKYEVINYTSTDDNAEDLAKYNIAAQAEAIREILLLFFSPKYLDVDKLLLEHGYIEPKRPTPPPDRVFKQTDTSSTASAYATRKREFCKHKDYITDQEGRRYCTDCRGYTDIKSITKLFRYLITGKIT